MISSQRLKVVQASEEQMTAVMDQLQGGCIYCGLIRGGDGQPHAYKDCSEAEASGCGIGQHEVWREGIDLGQYQHCWKCGLSQKICRRLEDDGWCEYPEVMLPGIFVLHQRQHLQGIVEAAGFQGDYEQDVWEWLKGVWGRGWGRSGRAIGWGHGGWSLPDIRYNDEGESSGVEMRRGLIDEGAQRSYE